MNDTNNQENITVTHSKIDRFVTDLNDDDAVAAAAYAIGGPIKRVQ